MGFTRLGQSPGISDDGRIVVFFGELSAPGAAALGTFPGVGIFANVDTGGGRVIQRIAGLAGNGVLDPGESFFDLNGNGLLDPGEDFVDLNGNGLLDHEENLGPSRFLSYDADTRIGVSSTHRGEPFTDANGNGIWDPVSHSRTQTRMADLTPANWQ